MSRSSPSTSLSQSNQTMSLTNLLTDNPVLRRELRARLKPRVLRGNKPLQYGVYALCAAIVYCYARGLLLMARNPKSDARDLFELLMYGMLFLIALLAPALSATAISQEREQQTWEILAVTRLTSQQVMVGKWLGRQLIVGIGFLIVLPFFLGSAVRSELGIREFALVVLYLLLCTNFFTAIGLMCSFKAKRTPTATASALVLTALIGIGTYVVNAILESFNLWSVNYSSTPRVESPVMWINPFYILGVIDDTWLHGNGVGNDAAQLPLSVCLVVMSAVIVFAAVWLTKRFRENEAG